jgi:hypothetical protein
MIYVADRDANRVAIFKETDGSFAGEIAVDNPQVLGVDPANGAVYVCAYANFTQQADLIKFSPLSGGKKEGGKELYRVKLPRTGQSPNAGEHRIAVDASAKPIKIWLPSIYASPNRLHCYEDDGSKFVFKGDPRPLPLTPSPSPARGEGGAEHPTRNLPRARLTQGEIANVEPDSWPGPDSS